MKRIYKRIENGSDIGRLMTGLNCGSRCIEPHSNRTIVNLIDDSS